MCSDCLKNVGLAIIIVLVLLIVYIKYFLQAPVEGLIGQPDYMPPIKFLESGEKLDVPVATERISYNNLTMNNTNAPVKYYNIPIPSLGSDYPGEVYVPSRYLSEESKKTGYAFVSPYYKDKSFSTKCSCNYNTCSCLNLPNTLFESSKDMTKYNLDNYESSYLDSVQQKSGDLIKKQLLLDNPGTMVTTQNDNDYYKWMVNTELTLAQ